MSYRKNVSGQYVYFGLVLASDGSAITDAVVTAKRSIDGGSQASCTGTVNNKGLGQYELAASQADMNGNNIGFFFTAVNGDSPPALAIPVSICVVTTAADPTDGVRYGLTALPNATPAGSGGLPTVDANNRVKVRAAAKKNTALANFEFTMFDEAGNPLPGLGAGVALTLSRDGAAPANSDNAVSEVSSGAGRYKVSFTAADLNADVICFIATATGARPLSWTWNMLE